MPDWKTSWVTDGAKNCKNARDPNKHEEIGFPINHTGTCIDHVIDLAAEDALKRVGKVKESPQKARALVNYMKDSSLAREAFRNTMISLGEEPMTIIQGTINRWFHKVAESRRLVRLKDSVQNFFITYNLPEHVKELEELDVKHLAVYVDAMNKVVEAGTFLEGVNYPTSSSVIPYIDLISNELDCLAKKTRNEDGKAFISALQNCLAAENRFPKGMKECAPYNCMTLLDPRYMDLYFDSEQAAMAKVDLMDDVVLEEDRVRNYAPERELVREQVPDNNSEDEEEVEVSSLEKRRAQLLAQRNVHRPQPTQSTFNAKIVSEFDAFLESRGSVDVKMNPMDWFRVNYSRFPLLSKYWRAYSSFPATSASAERVFNADGLVVSKHRYLLFFGD